MTKESVLMAVVGLLLGVIVTGFVAGQAVNSNNSNMMRMMGVDTTRLSGSSVDESMGMDVMTRNLQGKSGDDFDRLFLSEMIVHHQGAIDMANLAQKSAKHGEIKKLADDIITAQTKEIGIMKAWQVQWAYPTDDESMGGIHMVH